MRKAYEQYPMNLQMGIPFTPKGEGRKDKQGYANLWVDNILTGRRPAGEKEDLDF